jgi:hypothetical protein
VGAPVPEEQGPTDDIEPEEGGTCNFMKIWSRNDDAGLCFPMRSWGTYRKNALVAAPTGPDIDAALAAYRDPGEVGSSVHWLRD